MTLSASAVAVVLNITATVAVFHKEKYHKNYKPQNCAVAALAATVVSEKIEHKNYLLLI